MSANEVAGHASETTFQDIYDFLIAEAALLDDRQHRDWLALVTEDIDYRIPIRLTRARDSDLPTFSEDSYHMVEDHASLKARIDRFDTGYAWSQDPPPRLRRFVSNVRITGRTDSEISAVSYILFFYGRADASPELLSGQREDLLRLTKDGLRIARRVVFLDHTYLPTENLAAFL